MTPHVLPPLPYDYNALQPWIDAATLRLHYDHHRARVAALNAAEDRLAMEGGNADFAWMGHLQHLVAVRTAEHMMHCLFWEIMGPNQGGAPVGSVADQIRDDFGSFAGLKSLFGATATAMETAEWIALVWQAASDRLAIRALDYQQLHGWWDVGIVLALDVSEHAYYLQYQNRRAEYVHNWWNTVNWPRVAQRFTAATQSWRAGTPERPRSQRRHRDALPVRVDSLSDALCFPGNSHRPR